MMVHMAGLGVACAALSMDQIYSLARAAGFPADTAVTMTAIAMRESSGCPTAHNPGNPIGAEDSYGLWQINVKGNPSLIAAMGISPTDLYDPAVNAAAAFRLWNHNDANLNTAWYVNRPGYKEAYEQYLPQAQLAATRVEGGGGLDLPTYTTPTDDNSATGQPVLADILGGAVSIAGVEVPTVILAAAGAGLLAMVLFWRRY